MIGVWFLEIPLSVTTTVLCLSRAEKIEKTIWRRKRRWLEILYRNDVKININLFMVLPCRALVTRGHSIDYAESP